MMSDALTKAGRPTRQVFERATSADSISPRSLWYTNFFIKKCSF